MHQPVSNMVNSNKKSEIEFLIKNLVSNIRKIDMYTSSGPIEDKQLHTTRELLQETRKINKEEMEEKSEPNRFKNSKDINNQFNI